MQKSLFILKILWLRFSYFLQFRVAMLSCCGICHLLSGKPVCKRCIITIAHSGADTRCPSRADTRCHSREGTHSHSRADTSCHSREGGNPVLAAFSSKYTLAKLAKNSNHDIVAVYYITLYQSSLKKLLIDYKYNKQIHLKWALGYLLKLAVEQLNLPLDFIISVPMHWRKKRLRVFDHMRHLMHYYQISGYKTPLLDHVVTKCKYHSSQVKLNKRERMHNLRGTFAVKSNVQGKNILLVDDVYTTGATVNEIAQQLKQHGANQVYVLVLLYNNKFQ